MEPRSPTFQADSLLSDHSFNSQLMKKKITRETRKYLETNEARIYQKLGDTVKTVPSGGVGEFIVVNPCLKNEERSEINT